MNIVEKETIDSIMADLGHIDNRIEQELGESIHFTRAQLKIREALRELNEYVAKKTAKAA